MAMTEKEHRLLVGMFAQHRLLMGIILDILRSRETITADDLQAFLAAAQFDEEALAETIEETRHTYISLAKRAGVPTGLESQ